MKGLLLTGLVAAACVVVPAPPPVPPPAAVLRFEDALNPYGQWVVVSRFGRVWRPHLHVVGADFVPYLTGGYWVSTEHGWSFESQWPWSWAAFHYGRWYLDPAWGWVWVPGDVWAPAWVEWRSGGGYVGWLPLPPAGIEVVVPVYRPRWCFVEVHHFHHHEVWRYRVDPSRESRAYHAASPVPRAGPDPAWLARHTGTPARTVNVGPPPPPGVVRPMPRLESPPPPPGLAVPQPAPPPPPGVAVEPPRPAPPQKLEPVPPARRYERPTDKRPELAPPPPRIEPPRPPPGRFERPADRRPAPVEPFRIEPQPQRPPPPAAPAPSKPAPEELRKRRRPVS